MRACTGSARRPGIAYSPFVALDPDTRLRAPIDQVVEAVKEAEAKGVDGINLSAFRYLGGDPQELLAAVSGAVEKPFSYRGQRKGGTNRLFKNPSHAERLPSAERFLRISSAEALRNRSTRCAPI